jgi:hypothetical protein
MDLSLGRIARQCLGLSGPISVNTNVYGYMYRDTDGSTFGTLLAADILPGTGTATTRSLRRHLQTISGPSTDLVLIMVDHENDFSGRFTLDQATKMQYAVQVARDIYAQQNLGIRRLNWQFIPRAAAGAYADLTDRAEAGNLTDDWSGPGGGIDIFLVQSIGDADGWSNIDGPCDKNSSDDLTGVVLEVTGLRRITGILLAHETGHYLKLEHATTIMNVMGVDSDGDGVGSINNTSTGLTDAQGVSMRSHCSVNSGC